jgi:hypothetical protein
MDPRSKVLVVVDVGCRTLAMAQRVVHRVTEVLAPGCVPLFLTDGLKDYATALLTHFGQWRHPERRQERGPRPKPRWRPLPELRYAQVVKSGTHLKRDTLCCQWHNAISVLRCRARGKTSIRENTVSKRSGNARRKNREAGVVPSAARQSKLCTLVHTLYRRFGKPR